MFLPPEENVMAPMIIALKIFERVNIVAKVPAPKGDEPKLRIDATCMSSLMNATLRAKAQLMQTVVIRGISDLGVWTNDISWLALWAGCRLSFDSASFGFLLGIALS